MPQIFVSGHSVAQTSGQIILSLRDVVAKTAAFASLKKATKTGSIFLAKGVTMEEAKTQFPLGRDMSSLLEWGDVRPARNQQGEAINGIYDVVEIEVVEETEGE